MTMHDYALCDHDVPHTHETCSCACHDEDQTTWHAHFTAHSRDCDGSYDFGRDIHARPGENDLDLVGRMLTMLWQPSSDETGPFQLQSDIDQSGRIVMEAGLSTLEGGWSASVVICDRDDYEEDYDGFRDHSAERAGY